MAGNKRRRTYGGFSTTEDAPTSEICPGPSASPTSQPTFLSTFDRESRYPIFSALCDCLSIAQIVSLTRTCKKLSGLYQYLLPVQWDVDKALRRYVDDPLGFRSQMARCDALITGKFSSRYFERIHGDCNQSLSIRIQQGFRVELFSKYLLDVAGYSEVRRKQYVQKVSIIEVWTFKSFANDKLRIHLIVTKSAPAQSILRETATTGKVNFLSWNKAYSVFPLPTFIQYKSYLLQPWNGVIRSAAQNESRGGWNIQGVMWPEEKHINHPMRERRRVGDRYTWIIPFDTREVEWSKTPDYVLEYACFTIPGISDNDDESYDRNKGDARYYHIKADALESQVLRHIYTTGDVGMSDFISRRLHSSTILELRMLDPAQRPTNYNQILGNPADIDGALENFDRPASWRYRDDEIPKWCEAYERSIKGSIAKEHES